MSKPQWEWQDYYLEAFLDTNPLNLVDRVAAAEKAIFLRTKELCAGSDAKEEWQAIADAMNGLTILKREIKAQSGNETEGRPEFGQRASGMSAGRSRDNLLRAQPSLRTAKN